MPDSNQESEQKNQAARALHPFFFWVIFLVGFSFVIALFIPEQVFNLFSRNTGREAARRHTSKNNLLQMGLALHQYHETYGIFPPGNTATADGNPSHSWQTLILPYLDHKPIFNQINFEQPWNATENQLVFQTVMPVYLNPVISVLYPEQKSSTSPEGYGLSHYAGNELVLKQNQGSQIREIKDGMSPTIFAMEIGENFKPWGDPSSTINPSQVFGPGKKTSQEGGNYILMGDGAVRFITKEIDPAILKALSTPNGGEETREFLKQSSTKD
ncbi:DUF1559 family PulG-like putative transporter [Gimesia fumaroli]|uniref:DUF1559 domain-containing protein n=1 Tax=Gimesia fumaroli TaxID=2527976 RepID=A0A518IEH6_9PLAN|nr:DUF1559 domain-containing protein [Gimesia fumaroli]QDV51468.1 hypothetical protein Enr17x_35240 [Gimesia fumaroli]